MEEWKIKRPTTNIPVTTDNAKNQINAVNEAGLGPQIGCFAHVVNLASQKGIFFFFADPKNDPIRDSDPRNDPNREFFDPLHP